MTGKEITNYIVRERMKDLEQVYVPAIDLPEQTLDTAAMDMIGLFVYQGRKYTQSSTYYNEEATAIRKEIGERIGYANGNINEWSKQKDCDVEFAGSVQGDVYSVKGYDKEFRLCMKDSYTEEDGTETQRITFYENLNGIGLTYGSDLFRDRLRLIDNWKDIKYQDHDNWNNSDLQGYVYHNMEGVSEVDMIAFVNELNSAKFEYVDYNTNPDFDWSGVKQGHNQTHLYFYMNDNTTVELRLFKGGYVSYQYLGGYFVKMPAETFDKIFNACINNPRSK